MKLQSMTQEQKDIKTKIDYFDKIIAAGKKITYTFNGEPIELNQNLKKQTDELPCGRFFVKSPKLSENP